MSEAPIGHIYIKGVPWNFDIPLLPIFDSAPPGILHYDRVAFLQKRGVKFVSPKRDKLDSKFCFVAVLADVSWGDG